MYAYTYVHVNAYIYISICLLYSIYTQVVPSSVGQKGQDAKTL